LIEFNFFLKKEEKFDFIDLNGKGKAINKTISVGEIIKRKIQNLHQITQLGEEISEPKEKTSTTEHQKINTKYK